MRRITIVQPSPRPSPDRVSMTPPEATKCLFATSGARACRWSASAPLSWPEATSFSFISRRRLPAFSSSLVSLSYAGHACARGQGPTLTVVLPPVTSARELMFYSGGYIDNSIIFTHWLAPAADGPIGPPLFHISHQLPASCSG